MTLPGTSTVKDSPVYQHPVELLQRLIQFDTTNPPGNEAECVYYIKSLLDEAGIESKIIALTPERPNLIARLQGQGKSAPLLMFGHVDVVTTEHQPWQQPPFEGKLVDGYVWGRGALDMKGGVAMMLAAFLRLKAEQVLPPGDVLLAVVPDEEAGGDCGAKFLVEKHPQEFAGVRYAISEFGGFSMANNPRLYPIMVAEKRMCWMKARLRGKGGHGSAPVHGQAMAKLGRLLHQLDTQMLPVHITPPVRMMIDAMASATGGIGGMLLRQLLNPSLTNSILNVLGERGKVLNLATHNTVSPTVLYGSSKINVIPGEVSVDIDGRLLPGFSPEEMFAELRAILGDEVELELLRSDPCDSEVDMGLFDFLGGILKEADPQAVPVPFVLPGVSDARFFKQLGIQTYGYLPMQLPADLNVLACAHGADERVPAEAIEFGTNTIYSALQRF
jgi:acetylornithine deacetylase/succinyl-diaminopimelate desuccinylase-like protein